AARIGGSRKAWIVDECQRLRRKRFWIDGIPGKPIRTKRPSQRDVLTALASGRSKVSEVTSEHLRSRNERPVDRRRRALDRRLFSDEEEHFVLHDRSAESAAELIAFQAVLAGRVKILRIQGAVPQELKNIPMEGIRSRFRYGVDCARGMMTVLSGQSIHF